jgi:6-phosphogluconolactonase (cycloisomerase 2 family)
VLYVTNWKSNDISAFQLTRNGSLQGPPRLFPVLAGTMNPLVAVLSPSGRHLYVSDWNQAGAGDLSIYGIGPQGALAPEARVTPAGPPLTNPSGLVITRSGRYLFMAAFNGGGSGTVSTFAINRSGLPSPLASVDAHGDGSAGAALAPNGHTLYVANMESGDVSVFAVGGNGSLQWRQTVPSGRGTFFPALTPSGHLLVVANATSNDLSVFRVTRGGLLRPIGGPTPSGGNGPRGVVISPNGRHIYVAHYNDGTNPGSVTAFILKPNGLLIPVGGAVPTGDNGAEAMVLEPATRRLFVANFNTDLLGSVSTFVTNRNGSVGLVGKPILTGGKEPDFGGLAILERGGQHP